LIPAGTGFQYGRFINDDADAVNETSRVSVVNITSAG
jgi:hypothetical protein